MLAVKDERGDALAACGGLRSLTAARAVIRGSRAIPPEILEVTTMAYSRKRAFRILNVCADSGAINATKQFTSGLVADAGGTYTPLADDELIAAAMQVLAARVTRGSVLDSPRATRDYAPFIRPQRLFAQKSDRHRIRLIRFA